MLDRRPENEKALKRAWELAETRSRGDLLSHDELSVALAADYQSEAYYRLVGRLGKRLLEERGINLRNVPLVGYELCPAQGQIESARREKVRAARRLRKGHKIVAMLPDSECSFTELRAKQAFEEILARDEKAARQDVKRMAFLMRPREQHPRANTDEEPQAQAAS